MGFRLAMGSFIVLLQAVVHQNCMPSFFLQNPDFYIRSVPPPQQRINAILEEPLSRVVVTYTQHVGEAEAG